MPSRKILPLQGFSMLRHNRLASLLIIAQKHDKIMHNTDSKETINEVFGEKFVANINTVLLQTTALIESEYFTAENFSDGQIKTFLFSDWVLKGIGVSVVAIMFVAYVVYNKTTSRRKQ